MNKLKHTPGPWNYNKITKLVQYDFYDICEISDNNGYPENEANARLISAAPEMLETLIEICDHFCVLDNIKSGMNPKEGLAGKIINAIERATGLKIEEVLECTE